jgi:putative SOS response-associated peptidase YedK
MCGRYATTRVAADLGELFDALDETGDELLPDYNVAPTDPVPVVRLKTGTGARVLSVARWGLVPAWAKDPRQGAKMINARAETVATSSAYARAFRSRRCLVPADGWYEWRRTPDGRGKQAYFMTPERGRGLTFAGLWAASSTGALSCTVVTTAAVGRFASVHDRMPLLLPAERWADWLAGPRPEELLAAPPEPFLDTLEIRPVGPAVGDVHHDGSDLIKRVSTVIDVTKSRGSVPIAEDLRLF